MQEKLAVITGATKGIGKALVNVFSNEGFNIAVCSRNDKELQQLKVEIEKKYNNRVYYEAFDVSDTSACVKFVENVKKHAGVPEVLINNAGLFVPGQIHQEEEGIFEKTLNTNLVSVYHITRGFLPEMVEARKGYIFNMCSTASIVPYVNGGSYCVSKFGLLGLTKVLREEMKPYDIRVTAVMPGATFTASWEGTDLPEERFMKPEDVADAMLNCYKLSGRTVMEELLLRPQLGDV